MTLPMIALAAALPLHVSGSYRRVEVGSEEKPVARVLCVETFGVDQSAMTDEQRQQLADVLRRIDGTWANEDKRGRAHLALALSSAENAAPAAMESLTDCRFQFPDE